MIEVEVTVTTSSVQKVEVEFPIFAKYEIDHDSYPTTVIYRRIDVAPSFGGKPRFLAKAVTRRPQGWGDKGNVEFEFEIEPWSFVRSSLDYALGRGEYESSRQEFEAAVDEALVALSAFKE